MDELVDQILSGFAKRHWTLSLAESCTGGLVSAKLTEKSGISQIYHGSVISYSNEVKQNVLGVSEQDLVRFGAVSEPVAISMAEGVRKITNTTWAASVTGIAGPGGGTSSKPVGTVCFGFVGPESTYSFKKHYSGDRQNVQEQSVLFILENLKEALS
ncbi:MAG: CinA family protein [Bdellovibrionales bacterium]